MKLPETDLAHILDHTRDLWEDLRGARLFITGGTGFFGHWLIESFLYANHKLNLKASASILSRAPVSAQQASPHLFLDPAITLQQGNVRNFVFPSGKFSHIIHAATDASAKLNEENPLLMLDTIIEGTRHTLDFAIQCQAERFLLISSGAVYGKQPDDIPYIPEDYQGAPDPANPVSAYGIGKRTAEHLCALYARQHGLHVTTARCFAFIGPYLPLNTHFAIGNFILDGLSNRPIIIKGDGTPYRSYLYTADLAIWLWTALLQGRTCRAYNVGNDQAVSILEVAHHVAKQLPHTPIVESLTTPTLNHTGNRYVPDISRAKNELHLDVIFDLDTAINKTLKFYQNH